MRLTLVRTAPREDSLVDAVWTRAATKPAGALPAADLTPNTHRLLASIVPHLTELASAVQRRAFYVRLLAEVDAPDAHVLSENLDEHGDAILVLGAQALDAHGAEVGYDPEHWKRLAREIGTRKLDRVSSPTADPAEILQEVSDALAGALYALDSDPAGVPERLAAMLGSVAAMLVWAR